MPPSLPVAQSCRFTFGSITADFGWRQEGQMAVEGPSLLLTEVFMNIIEKRLDEIQPYENNPRHNDQAVEYVANSLKAFGWKQPIVIDKDGVIVAGHTRWKAAKSIGWDKAPCVVADDLTPEEVNAYRLADNKVGEIAEWDFSALEEELNSIDIDMEQFGFLEDQEDEAEEEIVEDEIPEEVETRCKPGDLWKLGNHRLICGDSTDVNVIEELMDGAKADMVFTDPPYNVAFNGRSGKFDVIENDDLDEDQFRNLITASCSIIRTLDPKSYYVWCNWKFYGILQELLDFKSCIVWAKNVFGMGKGYRHQHEFCLFNGTIDEGINNESDLWEIAKDTNYVHPTQKPVALCARALKNHKGANNIVDLFGGSGSTLIACEQLDRKCYMCELDPHYCDVIISRWETFTGKKAVLVNGN